MCLSARIIQISSESAQFNRRAIMLSCSVHVLRVRSCAISAELKEHLRPLPDRRSQHDCEHDRQCCKNQLAHAPQSKGAHGFLVRAQCPIGCHNDPELDRQKHNERDSQQSTHPRQQCRRPGNLRHPGCRCITKQQPRNNNTNTQYSQQCSTHGFPFSGLMPSRSPAAHSFKMQI